MVRFWQRRVNVGHPGGEETPIRFELFSASRLEQHAYSLAQAQKVSRQTKGRLLTPRVKENALVLLEAYKSIDARARQQQAITPAAEWLLDNFHIIEEQVSNIHADLPDSYYQELPKLCEGFLAGYPRVYGIVWALVAHTDSRFTEEALTQFVKTYQQVMPLTLGELWAIPITLRVLLVENLRRLAVGIMRSQTGRQLADDFVDGLERIAAASDRADPVTAKVSLPDAPLRQAYAVQILLRSHDLHQSVILSLDELHDWLKECKLSLEELVQREFAEQIADNQTARNIIISMRDISAFDWSEFVEDVSHVDACLRQHAGYADMDFLTRDRYRHAIEELAKRSPHDELEIAQLVMQRIQRTGNHDKLLEPGYYLIGAGRLDFERASGYRASIKQRLLRLYIAHAGLSYLSSLALLTFLLLAVPLAASINAGLSLPQISLLAACMLFPVSDIAIGFINQLIIELLPPRHLPRLELKHGVPEAMSVFVVAPTLLTTVAGALAQIKQMEIGYLSNPDGAVRFALLSDWLDADQETLPNDAGLLQAAVAGVAALNAKYGAGRFYVFHRKRLWNASEAKWMGWERKRGKLKEFNRLLRGAVDTSFLPMHGKPAAAPPGVCYVITLDADTRLPMGVVAQLVGVAAHPLNQPVFDPRTQSIIEGYGLLQPRVTPTLPLRCEHSLFHRLFAGASGTDAYASSVSELYQDLFAQGTYSGKGLYHVDSFEAALAGRVPDNTQLSHDLFESIYVRCALVSDIEFFEEFPSHTEVAASRQHRWTRGDWQLLPWILGVPGRHMPLLGRWKMLDNLRRSLSAPAAFSALVLSWAIPGAPEAVLIGLVLTSLAIPVIMASGKGFSLPRRGVSMLTHLRGGGENLLWAIANSLAGLTFLARQACLMTDAIVSTLIRLVITRRRLLIWVTALQAKSLSDHALKNLIKPLRRSSMLVVGAAGLILMFNSPAISHAAPILALWLLAPIVARGLSLPPGLDSAESLQGNDAETLRLLGRRIWRFFTTFVTAEEHYLPPDNFQEDPQEVIAARSSPTNFGLYLLSVAAARDFGWIGLLDSVDRLEATLNTLSGLPRMNGHFYNWYDTRDLHILEPAYISTVDSGNLAGHLLTLAETCKETLSKPLSLAHALPGLADTHGLLSAELVKIRDTKRTQTVTLNELRQKTALLGGLLHSKPADVQAWSDLWRQLPQCADTLEDLASAYAAERADAGNSETLAWARMLRADIRSNARDIETLLPWIHLIRQFDDIQQLSAANQSGAPWWNQPSLDIPLSELAGFYARAVTPLQTAKELALPVADLKALVKLRRAGEQAALLTQRLEDTIALMDKLFQEMDFRFLYDAERHMFALGYQVREGAVDQSYYDLLASEARLASFIAIAKREAPSNHWFHLGRRVTRAAGGTVLLSWSGSMFEYLMPSLVMFTPRYSLLDQTCRLAVKRHIEYGKECGLPWGVSESAFNGRDIALTYQYSAFGVPGLGMKRGLGEERVIAPYATALAAMYFPHAAVENFQRLEKLGALGRYGFYEALDYTPIRLVEGRKVAIVRCYMAHHQGMSLLACANAVHNGSMRHRFHNAPLIQAADLLLRERVPRGADTRSLPLLQALIETKESVQSPVRRVPSPMSAIPSTQLLSNGRYSVMITGSGSGYSLWKKLAVTRWREDVTRDAWGSFIYLRDVADGEVWSAGYQPTTVAPDRYEVLFVEDRVRIIRSDHDITTTLEIVISPEDDAEIRRLSLTNTGLRTREIEVTSYAEIVLASMQTDIAHPAFSNLFVQTEFQAQTRALIAHRRPRTAEQPSVWAAHLLTGSQTNNDLQYETDRTNFVGRGQTLRAPMAVMDGRPLSNTVGSVLDPIFSLRTRVRIEVGVTEHLTFTTLAVSSRQAVDELANKYHNPATWERVSALAWTHAQVQLHHLRTKREESQLFQYLANRLIFSDASLRPAGKLMQLNNLNVTHLWRYGISGDRPIILLRVKKLEDRRIIEQLLRAIEYWRIKGLCVDLVILNEKEVSYAEDVQTLLENMVRENQARFTAQEPENQGAVFVLRADQLSYEERRLLKTVARAVLVSNRRALAEQLLVRHPRPNSPFIAAKSQPFIEAGGSKLTPPPLEFFNGLGGFSVDGREYVIVLDNGQWTPKPWVNVIANPEFGFMVSESGGGCTWSGNSRENQLTPWSNDPVSDPSGEIFYIRDDESLELWGPTISPIRVENAGYQIRHGQGYSRFEHTSHGIVSDLLQFVSPDEPIKISCLSLKNISGRGRTLSVVVYVEWVLGATRSVTAPYVNTELDEETGALLANNPLDAEFGGRVAFADLAGRQTGWTGNRSEFIGRNGSLDLPAGLLGVNVLKKRVGAGLDACAVLETVVELAANAETEIVFLLGQGNNRAHAVELVKRYRQIEPSETLKQVRDSWQAALGRVQVKTPNRELDLLLNRWLLYQTLSCRMWARAGFYQLGGAYGFRDQLQDCMALTLARPDLTRQHLLHAAGRQFVRGDVQHWWHPPTGRGVRTHFSDDRVWLPYAVAHYIKVSGDSAVLNSELAFLEGPELKLQQEDAYFEPTPSEKLATLYEHCALALDISLRTGVHGLPLIDGGDWNDGMNRVGCAGRGESVWLAWFLMATLGEFALLADARGEHQTASRWREHIAKLKLAVEAEGWDGAWYRRAFFDDGSPLGSAVNAECRIDSIPQSWAVLSGVGDTERAQKAMQSVREYLVRYGDDLVLLFTPPFDKTERDPGYIKSYPPGVRENGGQYTHAAIWSVMAYAKLGEGDQAVDLLRMLNPIKRTSTRTGVYAYKVEPYVLAADIYSEAPYMRRGGWTWYTGAAGWFYRAGLESVLGLHILGERLVLNPCIPKTWPEYSLSYRYKTSSYEISVENPHGVCQGVASLSLDGVAMPGNSIVLLDDGLVHQVRAVLGQDER